MFCNQTSGYCSINYDICFNKHTSNSDIYFKISLVINRIYCMQFCKLQQNDLQLIVVFLFYIDGRTQGL